MPTVRLLACAVNFLLVLSLGFAEPGTPGSALVLDIRTAAELRSGSASPFAAQEVLAALKQAFDHRIGEIRWKDGDWAIEVAGEWFYWAGGRLLPAAARKDAHVYDPIPFYTYEAGPPRYPEYTDVQKRALDRLVQERDHDPRPRHPGFMNALWRIDSEATAWQRQKTTIFLGLQTMIHRELLEDLAAIEEEILSRAQSDHELARFIAQLRTIEGYNYRMVDRTATLSNHSYGIALDFIPASYSNRQVYWRWAYDAGLEWHSLSQADRFSVPTSFVETFEKYGFVWGGKWRFYDAIHFEYRPEILILNGFDVDLTW